MPLNPDKPYPIRPRLQGKWAYIGIRGYFITINAYDRRKYFVGPHIVDSLVNYLREATEQIFFDVITYVYMPDHSHYVLVGRKESSDLTEFVKRYKQLTGYHFKQTFGCQLWATSFHDHVLRKEDDIKSVGRYVLKNPVRAGLVDNVLEYPFSGSFVYDLEDLVQEDPFLIIDE